MPGITVLPEFDPLASSKSLVSVLSTLQSMQSQKQQLDLETQRTASQIQTQQFQNQLLQQQYSFNAQKQPLELQGLQSDEDIKQDNVTWNALNAANRQAKADSEVATSKAQMLTAQATAQLDQAKSVDYLKHADQRDAMSDLEEAKTKSDDQKDQFANQMMQQQIQFGNSIGPALTDMAKAAGKDPVTASIYGKLQGKMAFDAFNEMQGNLHGQNQQVAEMKRQAAEFQNQNFSLALKNYQASNNPTPEAFQSVIGMADNPDQEKAARAIGLMSFGKDDQLHSMISSGASDSTLAAYGIKKYGLDQKLAVQADVDPNTYMPTNTKSIKAIADMVRGMDQTNQLREQQTKAVINAPSGVQNPATGAQQTLGQATDISKYVPPSYKPQSTDGPSGMSISMNSGAYQKTLEDGTTIPILTNDSDYDDFASKFPGQPFWNAQAGKKQYAKGR